MMLDSMSPNQIHPVFGNESIMNNSPHFLPDDVVQFLFDNSNNSPTMGPVMGPGYNQECVSRSAPVLLLQGSMFLSFPY